MEHKTIKDLFSLINSNIYLKFIELLILIFIIFNPLNYNKFIPLTIIIFKILIIKV